MCNQILLWVVLETKDMSGLKVSEGERILPQLGDEDGFMRYAERFIFDLQHTLRQKPHMENKLSVLELCMELEDHIYRQVQERLKIEGVPIFTRFEALDQYLKQTTDLALRVAQNTHLDWAALYEEHHKHVNNVYEIVMGRKAFSGKTKVVAARQPKQAASTNSLTAVNNVAAAKKSKSVKKAAPKKLAGSADTKKKAALEANMVHNNFEENDIDVDDHQNRDEYQPDDEFEMTDNGQKASIINFAMGATEEELQLADGDDFGFDFNDDMPMDIDE